MTAKRPTLTTRVKALEGARAHSADLLHATIMDINVLRAKLETQSNVLSLLVCGNITALIMLLFHWMHG